LFLSRSVHPSVGFIAGWISLIAGFTGALAFAATALEAYAVPDTVRPEWLPQGAVAIAAVALCGAMHAVHVQHAAGMQNAVVGLKLLLLVAFLLVAAVDFAREGWAGTAGAAQAAATTPFSVPAFAMSLVWISLSYSGFNAAVYVAGEVRRAEVNVPRAMLAATLAVAVIYLLLNAVFLYAPPADAIRGQNDIAAIAADWIGGRPLAIVARAAIVLGLLSSVSAMVQSGPRVYAKMAEDGLFPRALNSQGGAPRAAILLQSVLAIGIILVTGLQDLLSYLGLTLSLSAAATVASLFWMQRRTAGDGPRASPGRLVVAAIYVLATVILAGLAIYMNPHQVTGTVITVVTGIIAYHVMPYPLTALTTAIAGAALGVLYATGALASLWKWLT
jgi:APA family basic amino acid/polyamine antiporter